MINYYYHHIFILIINSSTQNTVMLICLPSVKKKTSHPPPSHLSRQVENGCCFLDFIGHHLPRVSAINGYSNLIYLPEFLYIYNIYCIPTFILWHVSLYLSLSMHIDPYILSIVVTWYYHLSTSNNPPLFFCGTASWQAEAIIDVNSKK